MWNISDLQNIGQNVMQKVWFLHWSDKFLAKFCTFAKCVSFCRLFLHTWAWSSSVCVANTAQGTFQCKNGALQFFLQCIKRSNFANPVYGLRLERAFGGLFVLFLCKIRPKFAEFGWKFAKHGQNLAEDGQNSQNWWQFCKIYKLSLLISQFWSPLLFRNYLFSRFAETGCANSQYFFCLFSFLAF